jgi:hypothetical protein
MIGWIHLGTTAREEPLPARAPLDLAALTTVLDDEGCKPYSVVSAS